MNKCWDNIHGQVERGMFSNIQRPFTSPIFKDSPSPQEDGHTRYGNRIWGGLVSEEGAKEMSKNCKKFRCNQFKKMKKLHPNERYRKRPMDIPVKVWKELVKNYEKLDAQRKAGNESIQVLYFPFKIYLNL